MSAAGGGTIVWIVLFVVLLIACYRSVIWSTANILLVSEDMAHGLFAPVVAAIVVWTRRGFLLSPPAPPSYWALPVLGSAALLSIAATLANSSTFARFALLLSLAGCLLAWGGWSTLRAFQFPLAILLFTFPIPTVLYGDVTQPLQLLATRLSQSAFELLGVSAFREGNVLQLTNMRLSVVEACSGLRSLLTLCFVCIVYGYFFESRTAARVFLVLLAFPCAILINMLRITATGLIGRYDESLTSGTYHEILGWTCFALGFLIILGAHRLMRRTAASGLTEATA
ncbi:MAG TPA: exosortase/archaeosortase family protein [Bryobacteraceae bacterium]|nr:exosortase/archaeosortase family protein [Bryobacteraceae bacterium]